MNDPRLQEKISQELVRSGMIATVSDGMAILSEIMRMGYTIKPKTQAGPPDHQEIRSLLRRMRGMDSWPLSRLRSFFQDRDRNLWDRNPELYLRLGRTIMKRAEPLLAYDVLAAGLRALGPALCLNRMDEQRAAIGVELVRNQALALARSGAPASAEMLLRKLVEQGVDDAETMGILGRIIKDLALGHPGQDNHYLHQAHAIYLRAYGQALARGDREGAYYNGINAATLAYLRGDHRDARRLAREVERLCLDIKQDQGERQTSFWVDATLGEAALLQGDLDRAARYYEDACRKAGDDLQARISMVRQARLIIRHGDIDVQDRATPSCTLPTVMVFSGHMIDTKGRTQTRFPAAMEPEIRQRIKEEIIRVQGGIGYAAAAAGSDILFLETMLALGGTIHIVLPVEIDHFKEQSVRPAGADWCHRFDALLNRTESLTVLDTFNPENFENSLELTNRYLFGAARIRAEQMETALCPLAVLQEKGNGGRGGTAGMVDLWRQQNLQPILISLPAPEGTDAPPVPSAPVPFSCRCREKVQHHTCLPMLFADVKGYSQLSEDEAVCFSNSFLSRVANILSRRDKAILSRRTAGDGLFLVFHDLQTGLEVARDLQEMISSHNWQLDALPANLQMRISLDAGPCYSYIDPVMNKLEFCGKYVIRAARLEPITPPGHIYASDTFVALCRAEGLGRGCFTYAGRVVLPKNFGTLAVFHVSQRTRLTSESADHDRTIQKN